MRGETSQHSSTILGVPPPPCCPQSCPLSPGCALYQSPTMLLEAMVCSLRAAGGRVWGEVLHTPLSGQVSGRGLQGGLGVGSASAAIFTARSLSPRATSRASVTGRRGAR